MKRVNKISVLNVGDEVCFEMGGYPAEGVVEAINPDTQKVNLKDVKFIGPIMVNFNKSKFKKVPLEGQENTNYDVFYSYEEEEFDLNIEIESDTLTKAIGETIKVLDKKGLYPRNEDELTILIPGKGRVKIILKPNHHKQTK